jgi:hypothetical protein
VEPERIYKDLASGRRDGRPGLRDRLKAMQPGNTLVVWKLDRLGRDLKHLVTTVAHRASCGIGLKVLAGAGAQIDTTTANGRLFFKPLLSDESGGRPARGHGELVDLYLRRAGSERVGIHVLRAGAASDPLTAVIGYKVERRQSAAPDYP